jgi:hypothetical protein
MMEGGRLAFDFACWFKHSLLFGLLFFAGEGQAGRFLCVVQYVNVPCNMYKCLGGGWDWIVNLKDTQTRAKATRGRD